MASSSDSRNGPSTDFSTRNPPGPGVVPGATKRSAEPAGRCNPVFWLESTVLGACGSGVACAPGVDAGADAVCGAACPVVFAGVVASAGAGGAACAKPVPHGTKTTAAAAVRSFERICTFL